MQYFLKTFGNFGKKIRYAKYFFVQIVMLILSRFVFYLQAKAPEMKELESNKQILKI